MIPISDDNPYRTIPYINNILITSFVLIFTLQWLNPNFYQYLFDQYSMIPYLYISSLSHEWPRIIGYLFFHGSLAHLLGNLLFLFIFGDNVEAAMGHFKYLIFFLLSAIFGILFQTFFTVDSMVPIIGASGAISGVITAYMILFPSNRIVTLFFLGFIPMPVPIPAFIYLFIWIFIQITSALLIHPEMTDVAYLVHAGGIFFGLIYTLKNRKNIMKHFNKVRKEA